MTENNVIIICYTIKNVFKLLDLVEMLPILPKIVQKNKREREKMIYLQLV